MRNKPLDDLIIKKIARLMHDKIVITTWELIREKNFHLNTDLVVIDRQELRELVLELVNETLAGDNSKPK